MTVAKAVFRGGERLLTGALAAGLLGLALFALGFWLDPRQALFSYLVAFAYGLSLALGALMFVMIAHVTGATWFVVLRRLMETVAATLPVFAVLFVPLLFGLAYLYPWVPAAGPPGGHAEALIQHKRAYLNVPFFIGRAALYFAVWIAASHLLRRWSIRQDAAAQAAPLAARQRRVSAAGLPLVAVTLSFAAVDWLMSLEPTWYSTIYGVYYFAGGILGAVALVTLLAFASERVGPLGEVVNPSHYHALGKLLLTFVIFWTYIAFAQFFLIWIANVPEEVTWYIRRTGDGGWLPVAVFLAVGNFALPFFALLSRALKRRPAALAAVAAWILLVHYVHVYWLVLPALHEEGPRPHWLDAVAPVGVLGLAVAFGTWRLRGHAPAAHGDPAYEASLRYDTS